MAELHVIGALRNKRVELAGTLWTNLNNSPAGTGPTSPISTRPCCCSFDPNVRPEDIRAARIRARNVWFRQGECPRLIHG